MTVYEAQNGDPTSDTTPPADSARTRSADDHSADGAETTGNPQATVEESRDGDVERLTQELSEMKDRYLRTVAEMDNMRKRLEREKADFIKFSNESILKDMIPVLDSLDKAIPAESPNPAVAGYLEGVLMVRKQFLQMLNKHGLEAVESVEKPFDPNVHQAIQRIESSDVTAETVAAEYAKGYLLNGRLIRPAMVSVKVPS